MAPRSPAHEALGQAIRQARLERGLSQERLGLDADLDRTYVSSIERGHRNPTFDTLVKIADVLGVGPADLLLSWQEISGWQPSAGRPVP